MNNQYEWNGRTMSLTKASDLPGRAFRFLNAIAQRPVIFLQLQTKGFTEDDFNEGKSLLNKTIDLTYNDDLPSTSESYQEGLLGLDSWDEENFLRTKAALENRFPAQYNYIFANELKAEQGPKAIIAVQTYLERVDTLRNGTDASRGNTRTQDEQSVQLLYDRGILSTAIVAQLEAWLKAATSAPDVEGLMPSEKKQQAYLEALFALDTWFTDWSLTARTAVTRRDYRISLGIASRRVTKADETNETPNNDELLPENLS